MAAIWECRRLSEVYAVADDMRMVSIMEDNGVDNGV